MAPSVLAGAIGGQVEVRLFGVVEQRVHELLHRRKKPEAQGPARRGKAKLSSKAIGPLQVLDMSFILLHRDPP